MANLTPTMPPCADKAPPTFSHTRISALFSNFIIALTVFVEAERDIAHADVWSPAFTGWVSEAEASRAQLSSVVAAILASRIARASDRPLMRLAQLAGAMLDTDDHAEFIRLQGLPDQFPAMFRVAGTDAVAYRVNHLLLAGRRLLGDLAALEVDLEISDPESEIGDLAPCA